MSGDLAAAETIGALRRAAAQRLRTALSEDDSPALDARLLVAAALGMDPGALILAEDRPTTPAERERAAAMIARRIAGEPVARILGEKEFWGLPFRLSAATLVPRADTETVVEAVLAHVAARAARRARPVRRLLDLGCGSGAILIALLSELPEAVGIGIDLSEEAARTARGNADRLGFGDRALFLRGNWGAALSGGMDVIVSNPPYIQHDTIPTLDRVVREHDPLLALDGGDDGLDAYRAIFSDLDRLLAPDGAAFFEIGFDQAEEVRGLAEAAGFGPVRHRDLAGHDRVIEVERIGARTARF